MIRERLPPWQCHTSCLHRCIDVPSRALRDASQRLAGGRISRIEIFPFDRLTPATINEVPESPTMPLQPHHRLTRVLRSRPILHRHEFLNDAHRILLIRLSALCALCGTFFFAFSLRRYVLTSLAHYFLQATGCRYSAEYLPVA